MISDRILEWHPANLVQPWIGLRRVSDKGGSALLRLDAPAGGSYYRRMSLSNVLGPQSVALHLSGTTKEAIIDELIAVAARSGRISDLEEARRSVLERENRMSTGMKHGIAIPHGKTAAVSSLVACVGVSDVGVDFDALDREPCRIFIMTISPADKTGPHLQFLAEVSKLFKSEDKRLAILAAKEPQEVVDILVS